VLGLVLEPGEIVLSNSIESLNEAVLITRADLEKPGPTIIAVSPPLCDLTGYAREELLGKSPRMLQGPLTDRSVLAQLREACASGRRFVGEAVNYRKDGSTYILQWTVDPLRDRAGQVTHFFSLQRDVTGQRSFAREWLEAEARARAAHQALSEHMRAIAEAILVLESTKRSFQSKQLGELRARLAQFARKN
jgi:PAS domain S-box-containing protein